MCLSCGCDESPNSHGDPRHITLADLSAAADAAGITLDQAVQNIVATAASLCAPEPALEVLDITKADGTEQRYVLSLAYQAGPDPRIAKGADGGRDYFDAADLERACWSYLAKGNPQVGIGHIDGTTGAATVVESYVWRGPDWDFGDGIVVKKGDWLVGMILEPRSWELAKAGKLAGVSPQGTARRRRVAAS